MPTAESPILETLVILPWPDPVVEAAGHDPRSPYVEQFWLSQLGPTATWLCRYLAAGLDAYPDGYELCLRETASVLGLVNQDSRNGPFLKSLRRIVHFGVARPHSAGLSVRRKLPPLTAKQVERLTPAQQDAHRRFYEWNTHTTSAERQEPRARGLALSLLEAGDSPAAAHAHLEVLGVPSRTAAEAVQWAMARSYTPSGTPDAA